MTQNDLSRIFTYHAPLPSQPPRYTALRDEARRLAILINEYCPESREKSLAITAVQQAIAWANAAIAIHETAPVAESTHNGQ